MTLTFLYLLITNVQVGSDVDMTIVHLNLSYLIGWIVATNQNGEDAKTLWTQIKVHYLLLTIQITMNHIKNALGGYQSQKILQ